MEKSLCKGNFTSLNLVLSIPMKRCNNCGWFNLDSAVQCEKCEEESFEPVVEDRVSVTEPVAECAVTMPEAKDVPVEHMSEKKNPMLETVAFGGPVVSESKPSRKFLAATVMDATAVLDQEKESQCPKCRYPIIGYVEYCPNCGATVKSGTPAPQVTKMETCTDDLPSGLKATVRDIPESMIGDDTQGSDETYRLVPVDALGEAVITLQPGCVVVIGGRRYRFQK